MTRLLDNFKLATGLFMPDNDEGPDDFNPEPSDLDLIDADDKPQADEGDADSNIPPPPRIPPDIEDSP